MKRGIKHNTHPGELLYENILKENKLSISKASRLLMVNRSTLSNVVKGKAAISPSIAIRLEKVFGGNASLWVQLQAAFDLREAEQDFHQNPVQLKPFIFD